MACWCLRAVPGRACLRCVSQASQSQDVAPVAPAVPTKPIRTSVPWEPARLLCKRFNVAPATPSTAAGTAVAAVLHVGGGAGAGGGNAAGHKLAAFERETTQIALAANAANAALEAAAAGLPAGSVVERASSSSSVPAARDDVAAVDTSAAEALAFQERPSMDLFKAIFEDDDDSADAHAIKSTASTTSVGPTATAAPSLLPDVAGTSSSMPPRPPPPRDTGAHIRAATALAPDRGPLGRRPQPIEEEDHPEPPPLSRMSPPPPVQVLAAADTPAAAAAEVDGVDGSSSSSGDGDSGSDADSLGGMGSNRAPEANKHRHAHRHKKEEESKKKSKKHKKEKSKKKSHHHKHRTVTSLPVDLPPAAVPLSALFVEKKLDVPPTVVPNLAAASASPLAHRPARPSAVDFM